MPAPARLDRAQALNADRVAAAAAARVARDGPKPRLRFDKVAVGLVARLRAALDADTPEGAALIVSVTAPIRQSAKTAVEIAGAARDLLHRRTFDRDARRMVHGNAVRIRRIKGAPPSAPKLIGYVHNPETDPLPLFDAAEELMRAGPAASAPSPAPRPRATPSRSRRR